MKVVINLLEYCGHLKHLSHYDNNYYILPFSVNNCDILFQHYDECFNTYIYSIGIIEQEKFNCKYYLNVEYREGKENNIIFDSDKLSEQNLFT